MVSQNRQPPGAVTLRAKAALDALCERSNAPSMLAALALLMVSRVNARKQRFNELQRHPRQPAITWRRIAENIHQFDLFAAMRLIECSYPDLPRLGQAALPRDEPVRMGQEVSLVFPVASLARLQHQENASPKLQQHILGLFGPNGALPVHLTEYAYERQRRDADATFARFADVFHHRMLLLFYRAWAMQQPVVSADRIGQDRIGNYLAAIGGFGMPALRQRDSVDDAVKLSHATVFGRQIRDAQSLRALLESYFNVPVAIQEWIGHWIEVPTEQQTRLGMGNGFAMLGQNAVIGSRVWDAQSRFCVVVGPVGYADYQRFLPNGRSLARLRDMVALYAGIEWSWDLQLILKRDDVPSPVLGKTVMLGWAGWLDGASSRVDRKDYISRQM